MVEVKDDQIAVSSCGADNVYSVFFNGSYVVDIVMVGGRIKHYKSWYIRNLFAKYKIRKLVKRHLSNHARIAKLENEIRAY